MKINRRTLGVFAATLMVVAGCVLCRGRQPSLADRIETAASRLASWPSRDTFPELYERDLISLAREPKPKLLEAFRSLDQKALPDGPLGNEIWITGTLITILAYDCPPVNSRDSETWYLLKGKLAGSPEAFNHDPASDQRLAEWPWRYEHGTWHLGSLGQFFSGRSDVAIAPRLEYYDGRFKRRLLP